MKIYTKPTFQEIDIFMCDLCAGSNCTTVDMKIIPMKKKKNKTFVFKKGETEGMWDSKF